jgi:hypothetical protein
VNYPRVTAPAVVAARPLAISLEVATLAPKYGVQDHLPVSAKAFTGARKTQTKPFNNNFFNFDNGLKSRVKLWLNYILCFYIESLRKVWAFFCEVSR